MVVMLIGAVTSNCHPYVFVTVGAILLDGGLVNALPCICSMPNFRSDVTSVCDEFVSLADMFCVFVSKSVVSGMTADSEFGGMIYGIFLFSLSFISSNNKIINLTSYEIWGVKRWRVNSCFGFVGFQNFIFVFWNFLKKLFQNLAKLLSTLHHFVVALLQSDQHCIN